MPFFQKWLSQVPEIISTLRKAGKSSARQEDASPSLANNTQVDVITASAAADAAAAFAKKFEVLFCGRVVVAHKKARPELIDECIEKFGRASVTGSLAAGIRRAFSLTQVVNGDGGAKKPLFFKRDLTFPSLRGLDENGLSPELQRRAADGACGVQPTSLQENRTMLFTIGRSQIFLVSPETKKVAIEKSFTEISCCSQGIRHVDHFGFICKESVDFEGFQFVCYVFQCTNEELVNEIMLTLKQAFSVAALQQNSRTQNQLCYNCPLQQLHKLCDRIEGLHPTKVKLELQKHVAGLENQEQASVFESCSNARPKSDQEENELIVSCIRRLYEERQKTHTHSCDGQTKEATNEVPANSESGSSSSRVRLEELKCRAKRSLTESLEGIWKGGTKLKLQKENNGEESLNSNFITLNGTNPGPSLEEPLCSLLPSSPLRSHNSTGDLKRLETSSSGHKSPESPPQSFRRRASTIGHSPSPSSGQSLPPQQPTASTKPKLVRHYSVSTDSPHQSNDVAALSSPGAVCVVGDESPLRSRRHSWRQQIFLRVATPQKGSDANESTLEVSARMALGGGMGGVDSMLGAVPEERRRRDASNLRELWRKAILQQILLLRMEKENQKLQASESDLQCKRLKLDYEEITPCLKDVTLVWERMLNTAGRSKIRFDTEEIHKAMGQGVPRQHRGEIWKFLSEQYLLRHEGPSTKPPNNDTPYKELLKQLTSQQHAILIDLG